MITESVNDRTIDLVEEPTLREGLAGTEQDVKEVKETELLNIPLDIPLATTDETAISPNITIRGALKSAIKLSGHIFATNILLSSADFANAALLANINQTTLAASTLISSMQNFVVSVPCCVVCAGGVFIAREKRINKIDVIFKQTLLSGFILSIPAVGLVLGFGPLLETCGIDKNLTTIVSSYFNSYAPAIPAYILFYSAQQVPLGTEKMLPYSISMVSYAAFTTGLGYLLIRTFGFDAAGLGIANSISAWVGLISFGAYLQFSRKFKDLSLSPFSPKNIFGQQEILKDIFKLGLPFGVQRGFEVIGLIIAGYMIADLLGPESLSANQIANQYIYLTLTPYYCIGQGASILVGSAIKKGNFFNVKRIGNTSIVLGMGIATLIMVVFCSIPDILISPFINTIDPNNQSTVTAARTLLIIGGARGVVDAIRIITAGPLQAAFKDTRLAMIAGALGTCVIALPIGYILAIPASLGVMGMHLAPTVGIGVSAAALLWQWHRKSKAALTNTLPNPEPTPEIQISAIKNGGELDENKDVLNLSTPLEHQVFFQYDAKGNTPSRTNDSHPNDMKENTPARADDSHPQTTTSYFSSFCSIV